MQGFAKGKKFAKDREQCLVFLLFAEWVKETEYNVHRPNGKSTVEFLSENCVLFENLTTVNIHTEFIGGITYTVDGRKINVSKTVFKNGVDETSGTITYYLK